MEEIMHRAAQYLAAAGISFLEKRDDDSHTNLGWNSDNASLETRPLNEDSDKLVLNYQNFSLEWWKGNNSYEILDLPGFTHSEVIDWIAETARKYGFKQPYSFDLHYDLPYPGITPDYTFQLDDRDRLNYLIAIRTMSQDAIAEALTTNGLTSDIRIWPHHFDTGAYAEVHSELGIGFGMAMPDTMIPDFYLYVSGYKGHDFIDTAEFDSLQHGTIYTEGWKGVALPVSGIDKDIAVAFFNEAISRYKTT